MVRQLVFLVALFTSSLLPGQHLDNSPEPVAAASRGAGDLQGEIKPTVFEEITVTAARIPEEIKNAPQSVTLISQETLDHNHSTAPNQMVRETPGMYSILAAAQGSPIIRGQIGNRVLYLWNDLPLNNGALFSGPNGYFNQVPLVAVERIDILRGPGAVQFGSGAVGGVINIITPQAPFKDSWSAGGETQGIYGSVNGERTNNIKTWLSSKRFNFSGGFTSQDVGNYTTPVGIEHNTGFNADGGYVALGFLLTPNQLLRVNWVQDRRGDVQYYSSSMLNANGTPRNLDSYELRGIAKLDYTIDKFLHRTNGLHLYFYNQYYDQARATITIAPNTLAWTSQSTVVATSPQEIYGGGAQDTIRHGPIQIVFGGDRRAESLRSNKTSFTLTRATGTTVQSTPLGNVPPGTYHVTDGYVVANIQAISRLSISLGGRFESSHIHSSPRTQDILTPYFTANDILLIKTWNTATWSVGAVYNVQGNWALTGNIATAFRAPTFSDALNTGTPVYSSNTISVPNKNVGPERSITYELGPRYNGHDLQLAVTAYTTQLSSAIVTGNAPYQVCINNNTVCYQATYSSNSDSGYVRGVEAYFSRRFLHAWTLAGDLTYSHGLDTTQNTPFRFIPPTNATLALQYTAPKGRFWAASSLVLMDRLRNPATKLGDQNDVGFSVNPAFGSPNTKYTSPVTGTTLTNLPLRPNYQLPGYMETNLRGGFRVWKTEKTSLDLTADIQNLFNVRYREPYAQQEWFAPGLGASVGGKITF
jgi:outer membrane receptor protein involved in Fe transport